MATAPASTPQFKFWNPPFKAAVELSEATEQNPDKGDDEVYFNSEKAYYTTNAIERQLQAFREKYPGAVISPVLVEGPPTSEGEPTYLPQLRDVFIEMSPNTKDAYVWLASPEGELREGSLRLRQGQSFFQSPIFGVIVSAVVPVLGQYIGSALAATGAISTQIANAVGNALAKIAIDVAGGKKLEDATRDVAFSAAIQYGMPNLGNAIKAVVDDPVLVNALNSAASSAITTAAKGGDASQILQAAAGGAAGGFVSASTGQTVPGQVVGTLVGTGNIESALGAGVAGSIGQSLSIGQKLAEQQTQPKQLTLQELQQEMERIAASIPEGSRAEGISPDELGAALLAYAEGVGTPTAFLPAAAAAGIVAETAAAAAARAAIIRAMQSGAEVAVPALARAAATNPSVAQALASPAVQRLLTSLAASGVAVGPLLGFVVQPTAPTTAPAPTAAPTEPATQIAPTQRVEVTAPKIGTADAQRLAERLDISIDTASALLAASPTIFSQLAGGTVAEPLKMVDIELLPIRELRMLEAELKSPGLVSAADDYNVVKGEPFNPVIAIDASGNPVRMQTVIEAVNTKLEQQGQTPAPAPQAAATQPAVVISVDTATNTALVMDSTGKVDVVTVPAGTQTQEIVNIDTLTKQVVEPQVRTTPQPEVEPTVSTAPAVQTTPETAQQPETGTQPTVGTQPSIGTQPSTGTQPTTGTEPATQTQTGTATQPITQTTPVVEPIVTTPPTTGTGTTPAAPPTTPLTPTTPETPVEEMPIEELIKLLKEEFPDIKVPEEIATDTPAVPVDLEKVPKPEKMRERTMRGRGMAPGGGARGIPLGLSTKGFGSRALQESLTAFTPAGEIRAGTGKPRKNVWNEASLRLKDALGL